MVSKLPHAEACGMAATECRNGAERAWNRSDTKSAGPAEQYGAQPRRVADDPCPEVANQINDENTNTGSGWITG